jgi:ferrous iron transport protein B
MGVEKDNWPASVAIFTGLFAKEAVVGTITSLYGQMGKGDTDAKAEAMDADLEIAEEAAAEEEEEGYSLWGGLKKAFATIPENLKGVGESLLDPLGISAAVGDEEKVAEDAEFDVSVFSSMRSHFTKGQDQVFAYLLFVLLYVPCIAAMGVAFRELGRYYGTLLVGYQTLLGWSVATLYYQLTLGHEKLWIVTACAILAAIVFTFWTIGGVQRRAPAPASPPPPGPTPPSGKGPCEGCGCH